MGPRLPAIIRRPRARLALAGTVLVAGIVGTIVYLGTVGSEGDADREAARSALDEQDLAAAADHLQAALADHPADAETEALLAQTLRRAGKFNDAAVHRATAGRLGWAREAAAREAYLAGIQERGVRETPGRELLAQVQSADPPDRPLLEALYRGDLGARNWDRAGLWLHLWLERFPDDWAPRLWQAELLERFKKYDRARADYLIVLTRRPDQPRALLGVGLIAVDNRGDYSEAEDYLRRYLARYPDHPEANLGLARCKYGRGDLAGAREGTRRVLAGHPGHAAAALLLGTIESEAERDSEALEWLRTAEAGGADPQTVAYQLSLVYRRLGRTAEADAADRRFTELRDGHRALESAARLADREPGNANLQYEAGRLALAVGDEDSAVRWFQAALKQDPAHRPSHGALADYYARQSDPESAARADGHRRLSRGPDR